MLCAVRAEGTHLGRGCCLTNRALPSSLSGHSYELRGVQPWHCLQQRLAGRRVGGAESSWQGMGMRDLVEIPFVTSELHVVLEHNAEVLADG